MLSGENTQLTVIKNNVEYQEKLRKNLGPNSPAIYNGMAWEIYQRIRLGLSKDKKSDIKN